MKIKEALEDGTLSLEDDIDYADMTEEEYKQEIERLNNIINELEKRIEKAIKYIEDTSYKSYFSMLQADYNMSLDTLINILKGEDKE